jgi:Putative zinc-finger
MIHDPPELAAHVLGLLDPQQARAVEQHLAACAACRAEWEELRAMADVLDDQPPEAFLEGPPDGDLVLARALRQVRTEERAHRSRRRLAGVAAAVVAVAMVLGGGFAVGRATAPPPTVSALSGGETLQGTGASGASLRATVVPVNRWVRLSAAIAGMPAGLRCSVVVVDRTGHEWTAGSWVTGGKGGTLEGAAAVPAEDVTAVLVRDDDSGTVYVRAVEA